MVRVGGRKTNISRVEHDIMRIGVVASDERESRERARQCGGFEYGRQFKSPPQGTRYARDARTSASDLGHHRLDRLGCCRAIFVGFFCCLLWLARSIVSSQREQKNIPIYSPLGANHTSQE